MRGLKLFWFDVDTSAVCESEAIILAAISEYFSISLTAFDVKFKLEEKDGYANRDLFESH